MTKKHDDDICNSYSDFGDIYARMDEDELNKLIGNSEAWFISFDLRVPVGYRLIGPAEKTMAGDLWFNFVSLVWEVLPCDFFNIQADHYLVVRLQLLISDDELPVGLRG